MAVGDSLIRRRASGGLSVGAISSRLEIRGTGHPVPKADQVILVIGQRTDGAD